MFLKLENKIWLPPSHQSLNLCNWTCPLTPGNMRPEIRPETMLLNNQHASPSATWSDPVFVLMTPPRHHDTQSIFFQHFARSLKSSLSFMMPPCPTAGHLIWWWSWDGNPSSYLQSQRMESTNTQTLMVASEQDLLQRRKVQSSQHRHSEEVKSPPPTPAPRRGGTYSSFYIFL